MSMCTLDKFYTVRWLTSRFRHAGTNRMSFTFALWCTGTTRLDRERNSHVPLFFFFWPCGAFLSSRFQPFRISHEIKTKARRRRKKKSFFCYILNIIFFFRNSFLLISSHQIVCVCFSIYLINDPVRSTNGEHATKPSSSRRKSFSFLHPII